MSVAGVICEYNPFHLGHEKQFRQIRAQLGDDTAIVCIMSGNYVQRGQPAIFDKMTRAAAAVCCGASLVLELPAPYALRSAEGFARGGVETLCATGVCTHLVFGSECGDVNTLQRVARALEQEEFSDLLREELKAGDSFPAARQRTLGKLLTPETAAVSRLVSSGKVNRFSIWRSAAVSGAGSRFGGASCPAASQSRRNAIAPSSALSVSPFFRSTRRISSNPRLSRSGCGERNCGRLAGNMLCSRSRRNRFTSSRTK